MQRTIRIVRTFPHPAERVWRALTERRLLDAWFMPTPDFAPAVGHAFTFRMKPQRGWDGITHCEVLEVEPERTIAMSYRGEATGEKAMRCAGIESRAAGAAVKGIFTELDTVLRFTIAPEGSSTRLALEHSGFRGAKLVIVSVIMDLGWRKVLKRLARTLETME